MKKSFKQDFKDAEFLNSRLIVPSTCFKLSCLPTVRFICCNEDVFSMLIAAKLRDVFEKQGVFVQVVVSESFGVLVSACPGIKDWIAFESRFHDCMTQPENCIFVANRTIAQSKQKNENFANAYFAIVEDFKTNSLTPGSFIDAKDTMHGLRKLKNADFVVCYDDDVTSAYHAARLWWQLYCTYGKTGPSGEKRKFICVGGQGLMSSRLYKSLMKNEARKTEGRLLAKTVQSLYVSEEDVIVCDKGSNTGENLEEIAQVVGNKTAVAAVTQRLSLILYMSQKQQKPELKLDYFVIWQSVSETCSYMNGMRFASAKPILHYWAHVLRRWKNYSAEKNKFMLPVFGVDQETEKRAARLQPKYVVKQRDFPLKAMWQMLPFVADLAVHGKRAQHEYNINVRQWQKELRHEFGDCLYAAR
ncbi:MAG: hypothetical protein KHX55_05755 [Proteobacteria bacterium]|nr:hypothetical protein [Pseudomonadota bacterium]